MTRLIKAHSKRSPQEALPFERTTRFLRGRIIDRLRDLHGPERLTIAELQSQLIPVVPADRLTEIPGVISALVNEGLVERVGDGVALSS